MKLLDTVTTRSNFVMLQNGTAGDLVEQKTTLSSIQSSMFSLQTHSAETKQFPVTTTMAAEASKTDGGTSTALSRFLSSLASTTRPGHTMYYSSSHGSLAVADIVSGQGVEEQTNTPLNAPQPSLEPVTTNHPLLGNSSGLSDLGWLIPTVIVCIAVMLGIAFVCYYGVQKLELRVLGWCYRNCSCCCIPGDGEGGRLLREEQYDTLSEETSRKTRRENVGMREYRERSPSYGVTRNTSKEYTPRMFNPFDDDS